MKLEVKDNCPINNFEPCKKFECAWFMHIAGKDPNTGEALDDWGCSIAWLPKLLIENAIQSRQTGSAVESFRNEMVRGNQDFMQTLTLAKNNNIRKIKNEIQRHD